MCIKQNNSGIHRAHGLQRLSECNRVMERLWQRDTAKRQMMKLCIFPASISNKLVWYNSSKQCTCNTNAKSSSSSSSSSSSLCILSRLYIAVRRRQSVVKRCCPSTTSSSFVWKASEELSMQIIEPIKYPLSFSQMSSYCGVGKCCDNNSKQKRRKNLLAVSASYDPSCVCSIVQF